MFSNIHTLFIIYKVKYLSKKMTSFKSIWINNYKIWMKLSSPVIFIFNHTLMLFFLLEKKEEEISFV